MFYVVKRVEGSHETMGFVRRFLSHFLFAVEKKVQTFPYQSLRLPYGQPPPFHKGGFGASQHKKIIYRFVTDSQFLPR